MKIIKKIKTAIISSIIILVCATSGCDTTPFSECESNYSFERENFFDLELYDFYSAENLLMIGVNKYNKDTLKIYNNLGEELEINVRNNGSVFFPLVNNAEFGISNLIFHKELFLYLNQYDTDTLVFDFTMEYDAKCKEQDMLSMRIVYNDSIYFNSPNNYVLHLNFFKK